MATIIVDKDTIQEHFEDSCTVKVTSFGWNKYSGVCDVEYDLDVSEDLRYDDDDYIEIEEYTELKDKLQEMTDEFQESQDELALLKVDFDTLKADYDKKVSQINALTAIIEFNRPWYKFWK